MGWKPASWMITAVLWLSVSLDSILQDVRALERGMEATGAEFSVEQQNPVLQTFLSTNTELLDSLVADGKTAQVQLALMNHIRQEDPCLYSNPGMCFPGCVRLGGGILWRKLQDDSSLHVLPSFCPIHQSVQGQRRLTVFH